MGRKIALLITAGLTIFVIGTGGLLAMNLAENTFAVPVDETVVTTTADPELVDTLLKRDALYQERLAEANQTIQQANATNAALQAERDTLAEQNNVLLEREIQYHQAIELANVLLNQHAVTSSAAVAAASAPVPPPASMSVSDYDDDHDAHYESREVDYEEDDDD